MAEKLERYLHSIVACSSARVWANGLPDDNIRSALLNCTRIDWVMYLLVHAALTYASRAELRHVFTTLAVHHVPRELREVYWRCLTVSGFARDTYYAAVNASEAALYARATPGEFVTLIRSNLPSYEAVLDRIQEEIDRG